MHVGSTSTSDGDDAATRRWAPCSTLVDIADSNGTLPLPTIYSTRAGGVGGGGRGLRRSNLSATEGVDGATGVVTTQRCLPVRHVINLTKNMVPI
jgi:hypothetical protein